MLNRSLKENKVASILVIDAKGAFDNVDSSVLVQTMENMGFILVTRS